MAIRWEVRGEIRSENLERAFQYVIDRHEILRTRLVEVNGAPIQQVVEHIKFRLATIDIRNTAETDRMARLDDIATKDSSLPFDLTKSGMLRATLVRFSADQAMLMITVHHAIFDGYSIGVLGREIGTVAAAFAAGEIPVLPDLPLQYGDFTMWQADVQASGALDAETAYWAKQLKGVPYFELPADFPRPAIRSTRAAHAFQVLPKDFHARLSHAAKTQGVSTFSFGAAVASACLKQITGSPEILFGTPIAGRSEVELEHLIGPFINTQVLRLKPALSESFADHLLRTHQVVTQAMANQSTPFARLVELANPKRDPSRPLLVSVNFNLQNVFMQSKDFGGLELISRPSKTPGMARDLDIVIVGRPSEWLLTVEYCPDLFKAQTIQALIGDLANSFETAFAKPDCRISDLPVTLGHQPTEAPLPITSAQVEIDAIGPSVSEVEDKITALWATILNTQILPRDVSFFDLGGHSLLAVRLIAQVRQAFNIELGVAVIYENPTIAALTAVVAAKVVHLGTPSQDSDDWRIEPITVDGTAQPIITINEIGIMLATGKHFKEPHRAICVRLFDGKRGIDQTQRSFEEIAKEYAKVVKKAQPSGPYMLFGVCVHGNIALETARVLQAQGEEISAVLMKDVWEPGYAERLKNNRATHLLEKLHAMRNRFRMVLAGRMSVAALLGSYRMIRKTGILQLAVRLGLMKRVRGTDLEAEQEGFIRYISEARDLYRPAPISFPVLHVVTDITALGPLFSPSIGWEHVVGGGLRTVHLKDVSVGGGKSSGTQQHAVVIDAFLAEHGIA